MNLEPLIKGISDMIGKSAPEDVERMLGGLSDPHAQVPIVHDYLRGTLALDQAKATNATHVRDISVPVWQQAQQHLQSKVDADPELQQAVKTLFVGSHMPKDPSVTTAPVTPRQTADPEAVTVPAAPDAPSMPLARPDKMPKPIDPAIRRARGNAWNEFAIATEAQDAPRIDSALEQLRALHDSDNVNAPPGETPAWQHALDYMGSLEQKVQEMQTSRVTNDAWSQAIQNFRDQAGIDGIKMPKYMRDTVTRFESWADAQKPPTPIDRFTQALGVPRAVMSSADLSAPGRQGILMLARPEYWQNLRPMVAAWDEAKYNESQAYLRNHPDYPTAIDAGLALSDLHSRLAPREEAFASDMAERIPGIGKIVKSSEQAYTTFLNRLRFDVFTNTLKQSAAAGVDVKDEEFQKSLAEWINTSTGRGGGKFNPGPLSTILFSPRLALARFQTLNPMYYYKMHPYVRQQAIKSNLAAAAGIYGLVSLAALGGARVTWDFRNADAGKIRVGNTRLDLGGGMLQFLRLFTQLATGEKVNSETGKVTKLGSKFGVPSRLDVLTNFLIGKEAPVASFVTDYLRGKDMSGQKFNLTDAVIQRTVPLAIQDMTDAIKDQGVQGLIYAFPAVFGVGLQTYKGAATKEYVPFIGVKGQVPDSLSVSYAHAMASADTLAAQQALARSRGKPSYVADAILKRYVQVEREKARKDWITANRDSFVAAKKAGEKQIMLTPPQQGQP